MTSPSPTLRCLSCGYDIASLVEQRGRVNPGVCPECGKTLRESILGLGRHYDIQHGWSLRAHARWVFECIARPMTVARRMDLPPAGRLVKLNAVGAAGVLGLMLAAIAIGSLTTGVMGFAYLSAIAFVVAVMIWLVVCLTAMILAVALAGACLFIGLPPLGRHVYAALDISTAWLVPWPILLPVLWIGLWIIYGSSWMYNTANEPYLYMLLAWMLVPLAALVVGLLTLLPVGERIGLEA